MAAKATRDRAKVPTSTPKVAGSPGPAMRSPARAGPTIMATVPWSDSMAAVDASSWASTRRGMRACSAGLWIPLSPAMAPAITNRSHVRGRSRTALTSRAGAHRAGAGSAASPRRRPPVASATGPPPPGAGVTAQALRLGASSRPDRQHQGLHGRGLDPGREPHLVQGQARVVPAVVMGAGLRGPGGVGVPVAAVPPAAVPHVTFPGGDRVRSVEQPLGLAGTMKLLAFHVGPPSGFPHSVGPTRALRNPRLALLRTRTGQAMANKREGAPSQPRRWPKRFQLVRDSAGRRGATPHLPWGWPRGSSAATS